MAKHVAPRKKVYTEAEDRELGIAIRSEVDRSYSATYKEGIWYVVTYSDNSWIPYTPMNWNKHGRR